MIGFQEVHTYLHLRLLRQRMPSFPHVAFGRTAVGPAGGLATFSRVPLAAARFDRFGGARQAGSGLPWRARVIAARNGSLTVRLAGHDLCVVNIHPAANHDGDWSEGNRFTPIQASQYSAIGDLVRTLPARTVLLGDFNAPRGAPVHAALMARAGLRDVFDAQCPPTFHPEYLRSGAKALCIDFLLGTEAVTATGAEIFLDKQVPLPGGDGYVSDHVGLRADVLLPD
ncbi:MAG TPA: endonuclease/exonuclease/phosphatase family protein [Actinocrinis sp.]|nr:endonuclease/exonuclease/phosphatase family protein [Actinocrinis sp.]